MNTTGTVTTWTGLEAVNEMLKEPGIVFGRQSHLEYNVFYDLWFKEFRYLNKEELYVYPGINVEAAFSLCGLLVEDWVHTGYMGVDGFSDVRCLKPGTKTYHKNDAGEIVYE